ncbi:hypothetical protein [Nocardia flavorosea]|uniref:Uncharacterized protein n=1 Tax=Nocardia flavorosea TaxID=53429 RepID=A0A846YU68_9NOCA|nr:hypothetical protein [Nocardia flavorosea]NKY60529.1 hypothetical protein [Nocardia flavorosea]
MADEQETQLKHWQNLRTQAENGEIVMEADIAAKLAARCDTFMKQLDIAVEQASNLQYISGFGGLRSAQALAAKFSKKAVGDEDSAVNRLNQSIEIVKLMKQTFELARKQISETDQQTSQTLGNAGP